MIRILVADDEVLERSAMYRILSAAIPEEKMLIDEASNGNEALEKAKLNKPDIVFLDIRMPGIDGLEVARNLSESSDPPVIIMISAYDQFSYAKMAIRFAVREYLLKPASVQDINTALHNALTQISHKREETTHRSEIQNIASNLKDALTQKILSTLAEGTIDAADLRRLISLEHPRQSWVCVTMTAGMRTTTGERNPSIASREFPRIFSALSERFLASDLGLSPHENRLLLAFSRSKKDVQDPFAVSAMSANALLVVIMEPREPELSPMKNDVSLRQIEALVRARIGEFCERCERAGTGPLKIGLSVSNPAEVDRAVRAARIGYDVANSRVPAIFLAPVGIESIRDVQESTSANLAARALTWLNENLMANIGIEVSAHALGVSPSHLSRMLKKELGISFGEALARIRIARAKMLLANSLSVKESCFFAGFRDQSYFSKVFLKFEGVLPSEFKEDLLN